MILNVDFRLNGVCRRNSSGERRRNLNLNFLTYNQLTQQRSHNKKYDDFIKWHFAWNSTFVKWKKKLQQTIECGCPNKLWTIFYLLNGWNGYVCLQAFEWFINSWILNNDRELFINV